MKTRTSLDPLVTHRRKNIPPNSYQIQLFSDEKSESIPAERTFFSLKGKTFLSQMGGDIHGIKKPLML